MKIELIHPFHSNSTDDRLDPPLGLLLIASHLRKYFNVEVVINDMSGKDISSSVGVADVYGITCYAPSLSTCEEIAIKCREQNELAIVVAGGAHASALPSSFSKFPWDYVVAGDGEKAMGKIIKYPTEPIIYGDPADEFHFPSFDLIDVNSYHRTIAGLKSLPILTTRGCPFKCAFCGLNTMHGLGVIRFAKSETILEHISRIKSEFGIQAINFQDDMFTMGKQRLYHLLDLITPLNIKFRCHGRAGFDTEEVYERLAKAGCVQVSWGIESGSQEILDRMNKKVTVQDNYNVIQWAKKYGIISRTFFVIGFPGETSKTLDETRNFILQAQPDQYFVSNFVPYPGTDVWNYPTKYGITWMSKNFEDYYQVSKNGTGGLTIDTEWLSRNKFRDLELEFRSWLHKNIKMKGSLLDYEKEMENR